MKGTFEVIAYKGKERSVRYITVTLYNGIANAIHDKMKRLGYKRIDVRLLPYV